MVTEDLAPVHERLVRGHDGTGSLVAPIDQPEEQAGFLSRHRQVADLVQDLHLRVGQLLKLPVETVLLPCSHQGAEQPVQGHEQHAVTGFGGFHG